MTVADGLQRVGALNASDAAAALLDDEDRERLLHYMVLMRAVEERGLRLYKQGKVPGSFYDGAGQEAISVGATYALAAVDSVSSPLIRDLGSHLVRGTDVADIFRHHLGRKNPLSRGREGNVHFGDRRLGVVGMVSMLPDMMLVANGLALAYTLRGERRCSLSFFGEGATSPGTWHEAMNLAAVDRLPVIFVLENNQTAYSTPVSKQFRVDPVERAAGYGIPAVTVDGNDVEAVFAAVCGARERAVGGGGPTLVAAYTMRMHGHGAHDDASYIPPDRLEKWRAKDPIARYRSVCAERGIDVDAVQREVDAIVETAVREALETPMADPDEVLDGVFCTGEPEPLGEGAAPWSGHAPGVG